MDESQAHTWLSAHRFAPYLKEANGDHVLAVAVYLWHTRLAAAFFATISGFEVVVRNAIDLQLGEGQPQTPIRSTWLMDFNVLQPNGVKQVIVAVERLEKGKEITRSRVVAGVSFGFWAGLFSKAYEELWRQRLHLAFPHGSVTRKNLTEPMRSLQAFRNRLAHHDCLLGQPLEQRYEEMIRIIGWIDPDARSWLEGTTEVPTLMAAKP